MAKPPPLPSERRQHQRIDLIAQVQCKAGGEIYVLEARNASIGGLFLAGHAKDHPQLGPGIEFDLALLPAERPDSDPIVMRARVVRVVRAEKGVPAGFGVSITKIDATHSNRLRALLGGKR
jgi:hypothetical protein